MEPNFERAIAAERELARYLRNNHGAIDVRELRGLGFKKDAVTRLTKSEILLRQHRGVYRSGHVAPNPQALRRCALLAIGADAALGRATAAHHLGHIDFAPRSIDIVSPRKGVGRKHQGLAVYHATKLPARDVWTIKGSRCTSSERTILDLVASTKTAPEYKLMRRAVRQATAKHKHLPDRWQAIFEEHRPFRGSQILAAVLDEHLEQTAMTRSDLEDAFLDLCREARIPFPETNAIVKGYEVDGVWRLAKVIVELDTYRYHGDIRSFENDRARDADLTVAGYRLIRITQRRLECEASKIVRQTRALLGL